MGHTSKNFPEESGQAGQHSRGLRYFKSRRPQELLFGLLLSQRQACRPRDCSSRGQQELSHPISRFGNGVPATNGVGFGLRGGVVGPGLGTGGPGGPGGAGGIIMAVIIGGILG